MGARQLGTSRSTDTSGTPVPSLLRPSFAPCLARCSCSPRGLSAAIEPRRVPQSRPTIFISSPRGVCGASPASHPSASPTLSPSRSACRSAAAALLPRSKPPVPPPLLARLPFCSLASVIQSLESPTSRSPLPPSLTLDLSCRARVQGARHGRLFRHIRHPWIRRAQEAFDHGRRHRRPRREPSIGMS